MGTFENLDNSFKYLNTFYDLGFQLLKASTLYFYLSLGSVTAIWLSACTSKLMVHAQLHKFLFSFPS